MSPSPLADAWLVALLWCAFMGAALFLRPLLPIDETRYVTVAWEMWLDGNFLVPHLNGEIYSHKPPLLFWLMNLGWLVVGSVEIWARLVAPLFGLGALWLTVKLARELWPDLDDEDFRARAWLAPLMMVSGLYWTVFATMTMFDMLLTFAALLAILGYVKAWKGFVTGRGFWAAMALAGLGLGLGGLAKGPAILVHTLPAALLVPLWGPKMAYGRGARGWGIWYGGVAVSLLIGFAIPLAWAIPAAIVGGPEYRDAIFIKQSTDRMVKSFAHRRPFYWFVWVLPLMLLPWTVWPRLWKGVGFVKSWRAGGGIAPLLADGNARLLLIWAGATFAVFSAISGKQPHYLLPMFPALALLAAWMLTRGNAPGAATALAPGLAHPTSRGQRVPVLFLGALALILMTALLARPVIEPMLSKPLPDWAGAAEPLWLAPAVLIALGAAWTRTPGPHAEARLIAMTVASLMVFLHMAAAPALKLAYDLEPAALTVKTLQDAGRPVAYIGKYHGEFQFLGRLEQPVTTLNSMSEGAEWAAAHPKGVIVATLRESEISPHSDPFSVQPYRGKVLAMWNAARFRP